jgi:predicted porin
MKRFVAAALLALVGVGAQAQEKTDTPKGFYAIGPKSRIYIQGRAYMDVEGVWASGAASAADPKIHFTPRVQENSSYLRFRGEYDLGDKWTSWAQIESEVAWDGSTGNGGPFSSLRNSAIGLSGPYGTFFFGYWDTPFKESTTSIDSWSATGIQSTYNVNGQMLNTSGASGNRWNSRLGNSVSYMTPKYEGLYARVAAGFGETLVRSTKRPYTVSAGIFYDGPVYLAVAYEYRKAMTLAAPVTAGGLIAADGTDQGFRAAASYKYKPTFTKIGVGFEWLQAKNDFTNEDLSKTDVFVDIVQGLGSDRHQLVLSGGWASDYSGNFLANNADTGALYWSAGYRFNWTKDLYLYAVATQVRNKDRGIYNFGNSAIGGFTNAMAGADPTGIATGMLYLF